MLYSCIVIILLLFIGISAALVWGELQTETATNKTCFLSLCDYFLRHQLKRRHQP